MRELIGVIVLFGLVLITSVAAIMSFYYICITIQAIKDFLKNHNIQNFKYVIVISVISMYFIGLVGGLMALIAWKYL